MFNQVSCRHADRRGSARHVVEHDSVKANSRMRADPNVPVDFCPCPNIDVVSDLYTATNCYLLEDQAIYTDTSFRMNHYSIGMGDQQAATYSTVQRNISRCDNHPKTMTQNQPLPKKGCNHSASIMPVLITPDGQQELLSGIPESSRRLTAPIGNVHVFSSCGTLMAALLDGLYLKVYISLHLSIYRLIFQVDILNCPLKLGLPCDLLMLGALGGAF
jgi:hypothetical protein